MSRVVPHPLARALLAIALFAAPAAAEPPTAPAPYPVRLDPDGFRLPREALFRVGSLRFRHGTGVYDLRFGPDGRTLATAALGEVRVWDVATGRPLQRFERPWFPFRRVAFSSDGKTLYAVGAERGREAELSAIDPATGVERSRARLRGVKFVSAEFSPDARRLVVSSSDPAEALVIDPENGKELFRLRTPKVYGFSPDGRRLVVSAGSFAAAVHDATTEKEVERWSFGTIRPSQVRLARGGAILVAGDSRVERRRLGEKDREWAANGSYREQAFELSADGDRVAHVGVYWTTVLDAVSGRELCTVVGGAAAAFSPDRRILAVAAANTVALFDATTGKALPQSANPIGAVSQLRFTHGGRRLTAVVGERWASWDLTRPDRPPQFGPEENTIILSPDGRVAVETHLETGGRDPKAFIDPGTGRARRKFDPPESYWTVPFWGEGCGLGLFSGDGRRFVANRRRLNPDTPFLSTDIGLTVWDVKTGKRGPTLPCLGAKLTPLAVSPDGSAVALRCEAGWLGVDSFGIWEPDTARCRWSRPADPFLSFVTFTADGSRLITQEVLPPVIIGPGAGALAAAGIEPGPFRVLDAATGKVLREVKGPRLGPLPTSSGGACAESVIIGSNVRAVSPDGRLMAVSEFDGTIYLWDLLTDRERHRFAHPGPVDDLTFSPDGRTLAAASPAGPVLVYPVPGELLGRGESVR